MKVTILSKKNYIIEVHTQCTTNEKNLGPGKYNANMLRESHLQSYFCHLEAKLSCRRHNTALTCTARKHKDKLDYKIF